MKCALPETSISVCVSEPVFYFANFVCEKQIRHKPLFNSALPYSTYAVCR